MAELFKESVENPEEGGGSLSSEEADAMNQKDFEEFENEESPSEQRVSSLIAPSSFGKTFMIHYAI